MRPATTLTIALLLLLILGAGLIQLLQARGRSVAPRAERLRSPFPEELDRAGRVAELFPRAAGSERLVPEVALPAVRPWPHVEVGHVVPVVAGRGSVVDLFRRDPEVEVLGPELDDRRWRRQLGGETSERVVAD